MVVNILQINLNRSIKAFDLLTQRAREKKADLILISEPPIRATKKTTITSTNGWSAITLWNKRTPITNRGEGQHFCFITVDNFTVYSTYISPNCSTREYEDFLDELSTSMRRNKHDRNLVIGGDFNAAHTNWGSNRDSAKGTALAEWTASQDLHLLNTPGITFSRRRHKSTLDLTFCSEDLLPKLANWSILSKMESLSDHFYIQTTLHAELPHIPTPCHTKLDLHKYRTLLQTKLPLLTDHSPDSITSLLESICDEATLKSHPTLAHRKPNYWWNKEIEEERKKCNRLRRTITRLHARNQIPSPQQWERYKTARKSLSKQINISKSRKWEAICEEINEDPWGKGYKIVMKKLHHSQPPLLQGKSKSSHTFSLPRKACPQTSVFYG